MSRRKPAVGTESASGRDNTRTFEHPHVIPACFWRESRAFQVLDTRKAGAPGIYVDGAKVAALGLRVRTEEPSPEYYRKVNGPDFKAPYVEKRVLGRAATNPYVAIMFHIPPIWHDDIAPLSILGQVPPRSTYPVHGNRYPTSWYLTESV